MFDLACFFYGWKKGEMEKGRDFCLVSIDISSRDPWCAQYAHINTSIYEVLLLKIDFLAPLIS